MNDEPIINLPQESDESCSEKEILIFLLVFAGTVIGLDSMSLLASFDSLSYYGNLYMPFTFNTCYKYQIIVEILFTIVSASAAISAFIILIYYSTIHLIPQGIKLFDCITYINYFIFGPFLLSAGLYGIINFDKVCYSCNNSNPYNRYFDYSMTICLTIAISIGLIVTLLYLSISGHEIMRDSIKFNYSGNYLLGNFFWKLAFFTGIISLNNNNNENNNNNNEHL